MNFLFCSIFVLVSFFNFSAQAKAVGYRVIDRDKTIIQIARDIYNDQSKWPKIAKWNNIKAPYTIHKGQVLVLLEAPQNSVPEKNLVADVKEPQVRLTTKENKSVAKPVENTFTKRQIVKVGDKTQYTVSSKAPTLSLIGLELYGNRKMGQVIAKWNGLSKDARLKVNQKLNLKINPTMTEKDGNKKLIEVWKQAGNANMVARMSGQPAVPATVVKKVEPQVQPLKPQQPEIKPVVVAPPTVPAVEKKVEQTPVQTAVQSPVQSPVAVPQPKVIEDASLEETAAMLNAELPIQSEPIMTQPAPIGRVPAAAEVIVPEKVEPDKPMVQIERIPVKANEVSLPKKFEVPVEQKKEVQVEEKKSEGFQTEVTEEPKPSKEMTTAQDPELAEVQPTAVVAPQAEPAVVPAAPTVTAPVVKEVAPPVTPAAPVAQEEIVRAPAALPVEELKTDQYWLGGNAERIMKGLSNKIPQEKAK